MDTDLRRRSAAPEPDRERAALCAPDATVLRMGYGISDLWALFMNFQRTKFFRYVAGSVITTIVSFGVLTLVYGVFRWWGAVPSTVFANVVATVPAYWLNRTWTWGKAGRSDLWREVVPFWVLSIAGIAISMVTASLAADFGRSHHLHRMTEVVVVDGANLAAYGVLFIGKYLVFNRLFRVAESMRTARHRTRSAALGRAGALLDPADHSSGERPAAVNRTFALSAASTLSVSSSGARYATQANARGSALRATFAPAEAPMALCDVLPATAVDDRDLVDIDPIPDEYSSG